MIFKQHIDILIVKNTLRKCSWRSFPPPHSLAYDMHKTIIHFSFEIHEPTDIWSATDKNYAALFSWYIFRIRELSFYYSKPSSVGNIFSIYWRNFGESHKNAEQAPKHISHFGKRQISKNFTWKVNVGEKCFTTKTWLLLHA